MKDKDLKITIKSLIQGSGRSHPQLEEANEQGYGETAITSGNQLVGALEKTNITKKLNGVPTKETSVC